MYCYKYSTILWKWSNKSLENGNVYTAGRGHEGQLGVKLAAKMKNVEVLKQENDEDTGDILCSYFTQVEGFGPNNKAVMTSCGEKFTLILTGNIIFKMKCKMY